jgi:hypothetical protein
VKPPNIWPSLALCQGQWCWRLRVRWLSHERLKIVEGANQDAIGPKDDVGQCEQLSAGLHSGPRGSSETADQSDDLTRSFVRLTNLPSYPLDRRSRYETTFGARLARSCIRSSRSNGVSRGESKAALKPRTSAARSVMLRGYYSAGAERIRCQRLYPLPTGVTPQSTWR